MSKNDWRVAAREKNHGELMHLIMTGYPQQEFVADPRLLSYLGNRRAPLRVLDFGCGLGRNCIGIARFSDQWEVMGYDLTEMIVRAHQYLPSVTSDDGILSRIHLTDILQAAIEEYRPNVCLFCWCIQHIDRGELLDILPWMRKFIPRLIVCGRTWLDDGTKDAFGLIESCGWKIVKVHERDKDSPLGEHRIVEYSA